MKKVVCDRCGVDQIRILPGGYREPIKFYTLLQVEKPKREINLCVKCFIKMWEWIEKGAKDDEDAEL